MSTVTLTGTYHTAPGGVCAGTVTFQLEQTETDGSTFFVGTPTTVTLDGAGSFSVVLTSTDGLSPAASYRVTERIRDAKQRVFWIQLAASPSSQNLAGLVGYTAPVGTATAVELIVDLVPIAQAAASSAQASQTAAASSASSASASASAAAASAAAAAAPTDATVGALVPNTASATGAALLANYIPYPGSGLVDYAVASRLTGQPNGLAWVTKEEHVARALGWYIITDARWGGGAKMDGTTDDTAAWQAALDQALATATPTTVWAPPGKTLITSGTRTTATTTEASDGHALVLNNANGNVTVKGSGKHATQIVHKAHGGGDPTTTWQTVGGKVWRGAGFWIGSGTPNVSFESLDLDGSTHTTGVNTFPADISTGDGCDLTHKGIWFQTSGTGWGANSVKDCRIHGYRGEVVDSNGDDIGLLEIRNCEISDSNGDCVSATRTLVVEDNYLHAACGGIETTYKYYQSYQRNRITNIKFDGIVALPLPGAASFEPCIVRNNTIQLCDRFGIGMTNGARNMSIEDNTIIDCGTTPSANALLVQTATGFPIRDLTVRNNRYLGVSRNQIASVGTVWINDTAGQGVTNLRVEDNTVELTAEGASGGFTVSGGFVFTLSASDLAKARIRNNEALGTTYLYTDQDNAIETLLTSTATTTVVQRRPDRPTNFIVQVAARVVTAATMLTLAVTWYDASGSQQTYTLVNGVSEPVGMVPTTPISINAYGTTESQYVKVRATAGTANQVYVSAKLIEAE